MKIITKCVIDMRTLQVIEEESCEYVGSVILCKGGGGGGSTGMVDYPAYMKTWHGLVLDDAGVDVPLSSVTDAMNIALGNSPFTGEVAYVPDAELVSMLGAPDDLDTLVTLLSAGTGLDAIITNVLSDARIDDAVTEFSLDLGNRLAAEVLPRFQAGMRDINAVVSSAFVMGQAIIEDGQTRQVAKYAADLHMKAFSDDAIKVIELKLQYQYQLSGLIIEANRMKIVAKKEEVDVNLKIGESDGLWDLEVFKFGGNLLASISGAAVGVPKHATASTAIGGALSGVAAGAMIGSAMPGIGTTLGAIAGGFLGFGAGLLD